MTRISAQSIQKLCRQRIRALGVSPEDPGQFERQVVRSVEGNLASGRFQRFSTGHSKRHLPRLVDYVDIVIHHAQQEHARISALAEGNVSEWVRVRDALCRRAYRMVLHFRTSPAASADAFDLAQQACLKIFSERYPFDVSFDAWAMTILKNLVIAHYTRSTDVLNRPRAPDSLDDPPACENGCAGAWDERLANPQSLAPFEKVEDRMLLLGAIAQLRSPAQQKVTIWTYLDQLDDAQIAKRLQKSRQEIYNLRRRALLRLRKILTEMPVAENAPKKH